MSAYRWKRSAHIGGDAQAVGEKLENLRLTHGGKLTPETVVKAARSKRSILHDSFEWDDSVAAARHRKDQARYLLRSITVVLVQEKGEKEREVRAFVVVGPEKAKHYTSLIVAMSNKTSREQLVAEAWQELEEWRERFQEYEELGAIFQAMDDQAA